MRYLSGEEILVIHSEIIDQTGGLHGVRDAGLLVSIINKPKLVLAGSEIYDNVFNKAAVYLDALARFHVFADGNKRTAFVSASRFLHVNGFEFTAPNEDVENFVLRIVTKKVELESIAHWLEKNSKRI